MPHEVLLINTPLVTTLGAPPDSSLPPIGLAYLATAAAKAGHTVALTDALGEGMDFDHLSTLLRQTTATVIGLNVFSVNIDIVQNLVAEIPEQKRVILGGPSIHALLPAITQWKLTRPVTVVVGEADHAFASILDDVLSGIPAPDTPWLDLIEIDAKHPAYPSDIDISLDRTFVPGEPLYIPEHDLREVHLIAGRGCPFDCAFCAGARSARPGTVRRRTTDHIASELKALVHRYPSATSARFLDDLPIRTEQQCNEFSEIFSELPLKWRAMMHVNILNNISEEALRYAASSGCVELFVGIESGDDEMLRRINKHHTSDKAALAVQKALQAGISVKGYFIVGFPSETEEQVDATVQLARQLALFAQGTSASFRTSAFAFRPYHGTALYNDLISSHKPIAAATADQNLAAIADRATFNITCGNFSNVSDDKIQAAINVLVDLGAKHQ